MLGGGREPWGQGAGTPAHPPTLPSAPVALLSPTLPPRWWFHKPPMLIRPEVRVMEAGGQQRKVPKPAKQVARHWDSLPRPPTRAGAWCWGRAPLLGRRETSTPRSCTSFPRGAFSQQGAGPWGSTRIETDSQRWAEPASRSPLPGRGSVGTCGERDRAGPAGCSSVRSGCVGGVFFSASEQRRGPLYLGGSQPRPCGCVSQKPGLRFPRGCCGADRLKTRPFSCFTDQSPRGPLQPGEASSSPAMGKWT